MPHQAASGRATARAETVSWSVIARAVRPTLAAAITTSQGEQTPSECVVWTCRSARRRDRARGIWAKSPRPASGGFRFIQLLAQETVIRGSGSGDGSGLVSRSGWRTCLLDLVLQHSVEDSVDESA